MWGLRLKKLRSTGDLERRGMMRGGSGSTLSSAASSESGQVVSASLYGTEDSFVSQDEVLDPTVTETYLGEWKNDRRCGFGVAQRSDGLKYEGEWCNNKKYGHLFVLRSSKFKERVETAVASAVDASNKALAKAEIALLRTGNSKAKAELADQYAARAREDADLARLVARQFAPEIYPQVVPENVRKKHEKQNSVEMGRPAPQHHAAHLGPALPPPQPHPATTMPIVHSPPANAPISKSNNIAPRPHFDDTIPNSVSNKAPIAPIEPEPHPAPPHTMRRNPSMARSSNEPFQQVVDDHFDHYMRHKGPRVPVKAAPNLRPPMGFSPESTVVIEEVEESPSPCRPARRSTLVVDQPSAHRTASLYMKPSTSRQAPPTRKMGGAGGGPGASFGGATMKRKKSLPDINANKASTSAKVMPREEISVLSSQRREEVRRQQEMEERLRANPFLYVCNPNVKAWISRQKLVILVLLINIALGFLFFRLLA
ncbi:JPH3 [Cordylochernes scorpioides]|uniref:JPH3 n=1 Tax=Cordylochernes scorpioides TaxID=51811 RepID=A0ABY6LVK7_9ARAC|nr:JPH3 [Cordylochernes scorpioides]